MLIKKIATRRFLRKVNTLESIPLTPNAFRKIDTPEIKAVPKTSFTPLSTKNKKR